MLVPVFFPRKIVNMALSIVIVSIDRVLCLAFLASGGSHSIPNTIMCWSWLKQDLKVTSVIEHMVAWSRVGMLKFTRKPETQPQRLNFDLRFDIGVIKVLGNVCLTDLGNIKFEDNAYLCSALVIFTQFSRSSGEYWLQLGSDQWFMHTRKLEINFFIPWCQASWEKNKSVRRRIFLDNG